MTCCDQCAVMAVKIETLEGVVTTLRGNGFLDLNIQDALKEQKDARVLDAKCLNDGISHVIDKCCAVEKSLDDGFAKLFHSNSDLEAEVRSVFFFLLSSICRLTKMVFVVGKSRSCWTEQWTQDRGILFLAQEHRSMHFDY